VRKQHTFAYLAAALVAGLTPTLALVIVSIPTWHGMASTRGLAGLAILAFVFAFAYLVPVAVLLRRLLLFRAAMMGVAGFVPAAALMGAIAMVAFQSMPDGSVAPVSWVNIALGAAFYGSLGAASGVLFHFVFRAIAGNERLMPGATLDA
jgi:hypothetical protein